MPPDPHADIPFHETQPSPLARPWLDEPEPAAVLELGYEARFDLDEGLARTIAW